MKEIVTVSGSAAAEYEEKRSQFICALYHIESAEEAVDIINRIKKENYEARHNCWAYLLKDGSKRVSDDGEPQGTAGLPMLDVLEKSGITDVVAVVTRYFGGILLGAGGLVRAYSKAVSMAVSEAQLCKMLPCVVFTLRITYSDLTGIKRLIEASSGEINDTAYDDGVTLTVSMPAEETDKFKADLTEFSAGRLGIAVTGEEPRPIPIKR